MKSLPRLIRNIVACQRAGVSLSSSSREVAGGRDPCPAASRVRGARTSLEEARPILELRSDLFPEFRKSSPHRVICYALFQALQRRRAGSRSRQLREGSHDDGLDHDQARSDARSREARTAVLQRAEVGLGWWDAPASRGGEHPGGPRSAFDRALDFVDRVMTKERAVSCVLSDARSSFLGVLGCSWSGRLSVSPATRGCVPTPTPD